MNRLLFTEHFVRKFERLVAENPSEADEILELIAVLERNDFEGIEVKQIDEQGYSIRYGKYRLLMKYEDEQFVFLTIFNIDEFLDNTSEEVDKKSKKNYSLA